MTTRHRPRALEDRSDRARSLVGARDTKDPSADAAGAGSSGSVDAVFRQVAALRDRVAGRWAYAAFDFLNAAYFDGRLPTPLILWELTPYGHCVGDTRAALPAMIRLHPQVRKFDTPQGVPGAVACDVLLHELIHVAVLALHGEDCGCDRRLATDSSHSDPCWLTEVTRIAPLLGIDRQARGNKKVRVPIDGGGTGARGAPRSRIVRLTEGDDTYMSYQAVCDFPHTARVEAGQSDYYRENVLPFPFAP